MVYTRVMGKMGINTRTLRCGDFSDMSTSKSAHRFHCMGVSNVEVTEMLSLVGLVGYLDGYWDLRNGGLTFDRNKSFRRRFTDISS
jgi:hypothetical protein